MKKPGSLNLAQSAHNQIFKSIHSNHLIYNACWEDPRIDRQLLKLDGDSRVVMITSAGCNALDYLLDSPAEIHAVDVNPRQNALLQLKLKLIEQGSFADLFAVFGLGAHQNFKALYHTLLKRYLPAYAREFWEANLHYFSPSGLKKSFYYYGAAGNVAWIISQYFRSHKKLKTYVSQLLEAESLAEQKEIYAKIEPELWNSFSQWLLKHPVVMAMLGVPRPQMQLIDKQYPGGLSSYIRDNLRRVTTEVLIRDNYFWRVYLTGAYTPTCCPNYLKAEHFELLRANTFKIQTYTSTITEFLQQHPGPYTHFVLLDHQDWMARHHPQALHEEWQLILKNSCRGSKVLLRSAGTEINYFPPLVKSAVRFYPEITAKLHPTDRVGTYGSLYWGEIL
ncbi:MAG: BtaA family protein [Anaerolineae bacterium]|nr:BtaA family protein [Anaerolineae bacterium]